MAATSAAPMAPPRRRVESRIHASATALLALSTLLLGWLALGPGRGGVAMRGGVVSFVLTDEVHQNRPPIVGNDGSIVFPTPAGLSLLAPGTLSPVVLEGTEASLYGSFDPDAEWLAFVQPLGQTGYALRRMPAGGGPISTLWESPDQYSSNMGSAAWGDDGWIYLGIDGALGRVPAEGGPLDTLLTLDAGRITRVSALPGGGGVVFTLGATPTAPDHRVVGLHLGEAALVPVDPCIKTRKDEQLSFIHPI